MKQENKYKTPTILREKYSNISYLKVLFVIMFILGIAFLISILMGQATL